VPADSRDLNYSLYFEEGSRKIELAEEYNSHNTYRLTKNELKELLLTLPFIKEQLVKG